MSIRAILQHQLHPKDRLYPTTDHRQLRRSTRQAGITIPIHRASFLCLNGAETEFFYPKIKWHRFSLASRIPTESAAGPTIMHLLHRSPAWAASGKKRPGQGQGSRMNVGPAAELTNEKPTVDHNAGFGSYKFSPALKGPAVSKPQRVVYEPAQLPERFDA